MTRRIRSHSYPRNDLPWVSLALCMLGLLLFLAVTVTAGSLSRALSSLRINIAGFSERDRTPILLECREGGARSLDGRYYFSLAPEREAREAQHWSGTPFTDFLADISRQPGGDYVLFLVRPDGIQSFKVLRDVLVLRNDSLCTASFSVGESLSTWEEKGLWQALPKDLRDKLQREDGTLSFTGRMSAGERETLVRTMGDEVRPIADALFTRSQNSVPCVDHGSELVPAAWKFERDEQGQVRVLQPQR